MKFSFYKAAIGCVFVLFCTVVLGSCDVLDKVKGNSVSKGMYYCVEDIAVPSDFDEINKAINNNELLYSSKYSKTYATRDIFFYDNGLFRDGDAYFGRLRFCLIKKFSAMFIKVTGSSTVDIYFCYMYDYGTGDGGELLYEVKASYPMGRVGYYAKPTSYTYYCDGDVMTVSNGYQFIIEKNSLKPVGENKIYVKK